MMYFVLHCEIIPDIMTCFCRNKGLTLLVNNVHIRLDIKLANPIEIIYFQVMTIKVDKEI